MEGGHTVSPIDRPMKTSCKHGLIKTIPAYISNRPEFCHFQEFEENNP